MSVTAQPGASTASPWAMETVELIDNVIHGRVLVYGSLPPDGGDIDLLARPAELSAIREALIGAGYLPVGRMLVRFHPGSRELVELTPANAFGLPPEELDALFAESEAIAGAQWLVWPSRHHTLLIRARKGAQRRALLEKISSQTAVFPANDPDTWRRADERATKWHARRALHLLRLAVQHEGRVPWPARCAAVAERMSGHEVRGLRGRLRIMRDLLPLPRLPRLRRTYVVAFSGLDGSGKTSQARLLRDALRASGRDAVVVWAGIGTNRSLVRIKSPVKRMLRALPRIGPLSELIVHVTPKPDGKSSPLAEPGVSIRRHGIWFNTTTRVWMTIMAIANAYSMRKALLRGFSRGRIVIFDRYALDSAVRLRHWYGDSLTTRFVIKLLQHVLKRPLRAYFLDVPPQVAFDRKPEWELHDLECRAKFYQDEYARLGVRRLDGTRPVDELFAEIATDVWSGLL
jgi:thymidylate kinase